MFTKLGLALVLFGLALNGSFQSAPIITIKHLESMQYPELARQARLKGSISINLKLSVDGTVVDATANTADEQLTEHPLLQTETLKLIRKWRFGCLNCAPNADYEHVLIFTYRLEGQETRTNNSRFVMDLPDRVTVTTNPPQIGWDNATVGKK